MLVSVQLQNAPGLTQYWASFLIAACIQWPLGEGDGKRSLSLFHSQHLWAHHSARVCRMPNATAFSLCLLAPLPQDFDPNSISQQVFCKQIFDAESASQELDLCVTKHIIKSEFCLKGRWLVLIPGPIEFRVPIREWRLGICIIKSTQKMILLIKLTLTMTVVITLIMYKNWRVEAIVVREKGSEN